MQTEQTVKCPICGKPYKVYMFTVADQSACHKCVAKATKNSGGYKVYERFDGTGNSK